MVYPGIIEEAEVVDSKVEDVLVVLAYSTPIVIVLIRGVDVETGARLVKDSVALANSRVINLVVTLGFIRAAIPPNIR